MKIITNALTFLAPLLSVLSASASPVSCGEQIVSLMKQTPQFSDDTLKIIGSTMIPKGGTYFLEMEDYVNDTGQDVEQIVVADYQMAVHMKTHSILADPQTCRPLKSFAVETDSWD